MRHLDGRADLDEQALKRLVALFYAGVREDAGLGPIFNDAITDWTELLKKVAAFWSVGDADKRALQGKPSRLTLKHRDRIVPALFDGWLRL